jgi:ribosome-associated protein
MVMDEDHDDGLGGRSRTRREVTEGNRWGRALYELDAAQFAAAPIPPEVRAEAEVARRATSYRARDRATMRVDALVRDLDEGQVRRLDRFLGAPPELRAHPQTVAWSRRLLDEGDAAVQALVDERPGLDVQRLRQLLRNARGRAAPARARAALDALLDELFYASVDGNLGQ